MKSRHDPKLEGLVNREKSNYLFTALNNYTTLCFFPDYRFVSQISSSQLPLEIQKSPVTPPSTPTSNGQKIRLISLAGESQMRLPFSISIVNTPACKTAALAPNLFSGIQSCLSPNTSHSSQCNLLLNLNRMITQLRSFSGFSQSLEQHKRFLICFSNAVHVSGPHWFLQSYT